MMSDAVEWIGDRAGNSLPRAIGIGLILLFGSGPVFGQRASEVFVLYNRNSPESHDVARHYSEKRGVPASQVLGLDLPDTLAISRQGYDRKIQQPLLDYLKENKLFVFGKKEEEAEERLLESESKPGEQNTKIKLLKSSIRYLVLCYGVPVKISPDETLQEKETEHLPPEVRRNEAALDSELALLPHRGSGNPLPYYGLLTNPLYGATNRALIHPTNGVLMVARLDGPTAQIARSLVDKAMQAEEEGLWGRAYFDARGISEGNYKPGDVWIKQAARIAERMGFETILDDEPSTFDPSFPMSHAGFYAGWYDTSVSGPFQNGYVQFMPGAFAYHLHSSSAANLRLPDQYWVGPLLRLGATATMGSVYEPYLAGTPDIGMFALRFIAGKFSFGEAAYAAQRNLSWMTTVVGDPLYEPFAIPPQELHRKLEQRESRLIQWSHLRVVNLNLATGATAFEAAQYLKKLAVTQQSAVLLEKLADLYYQQAGVEESIEALEKALQQSPSPLQEIRLRLHLARRFALYLEPRKAFDAYQELLKIRPDYPDRASILQKMRTLTDELEAAQEKTELLKRLEELQR